MGILLVMFGDLRLSHHRRSECGIGGQNHLRLWLYPAINVAKRWDYIHVITANSASVKNACSFIKGGCRTSKMEEFQPAMFV